MEVGKMKIHEKEAQKKNISICGLESATDHVYQSTDDSPLLKKRKESKNRGSLLRTNHVGSWSFYFEMMPNNAINCPGGRCRGPVTFG